MTLRKFVIVLALLGLTHQFARSSTCVSIADGAFSVFGSWDCGCLPLTCDTLIIAHTITATDTLDLGHRTLIIQGQGQLTLISPFTTAGDLLNWGAIISSSRMSFAPEARIRNHGSWYTEKLYCYFALGFADTLLNTGIFNVADTARVVGSYPTIVNQGTMTGGYFETSALYNEGVFNVRDLYMYLVCSNSGSLSCSHYLWSWGAFSAESTSTTVADSIIVNGGLLAYQADIVAHRLLAIGTPGLNTGTLEVSTGMTVYSDGDLINYGLITGSGDICVQGLTANYGQITSTPDICDQTLTVTAPPFLDVNTGTVGPNVNWCANADCSTLGIAATNSTDLLVSPNPATEHVRIEGLGAPPRQIELLDLQGRPCTAGHVWSEGVLILERAELPTGPYLLRVVQKDGAARMARLVFD